MYPVPPSAETQGTTDRHIASWLAGRDRKSVVLATKVAGFGNKYIRPDAPGGVTRITPAQIAASVDASLQRLGTDYIDLLQARGGVCGW